VYHFATAGLVDAKTYQLWSQPPDGEQPVLVGKIAVESGIARLYSPDTPIGASTSGNATRLEDVGLFEHGYRSGEPIEFGIISDDGSIRAFAKAIPFPIEAGAAGSCHLEGTLKDKQGDVAIEGSGFVPHEKVATTFQSGSKVLNDSVTADAAGRFAAGTLPEVKGQTGGKATFTAVGKSCNLSVDYYWGDQLKIK
jgi:hypothetical protein